jgi:hypothetical protein
VKEVKNFDKKKSEKNLKYVLGKKKWFFFIIFVFVFL